MAHDHVLEEVADVAAVAEVLAALGVELVEELPCRLVGLRAEDVAVLFALQKENAHQLRPGVVLEVEELVEAGLEAGVGVEEFAHRLGVARDDHHEIVAVVLHGLEERLDGLAAEVVLAAGGEGVGLVDEEHAAEGGLDDLLGLEGGLSDVARHETGTVHLDELALFQRADRGVEPADEPGHRGLARAGIAHEHHVHRHRGDGQLVLLTQLAHLDEVHQALDVFLDVLQADQTLELGHQLVEVGLFLLLLGPGVRFGLSAGGLGLGRMLFREARLAAGDEVEGIERLLGLAHAGGVADGGQLVGALGDILGLGVGHVVVDGREVEQDVRQHPDEGAGGLRAAPGVALG